MRRLLVAMLVPALLVPAAAASAGRLPVPELLRVASRLTGIAPKVAPRVAVVSPAALRAQALRALDRRYPPSQRAYDTELYRALGVLGPAEELRPLLVRAAPTGAVWDAGSRTVFVRRGGLERTLALEGLARALAAGSTAAPKRPQGVVRDSDAAAAAGAAVEGSVQLALRGVTRDEPEPATPRSAAARFVGLEAQFAGAVGLRLASNLWNVGGDRAARELLRRPPATTEQVFHVDKYLAHERAAAVELPAHPAGFELAGDDTFGELDVRALLAIFQVPRLDRVASGWGGGLSALYRGADGTRAAVLRLDWDSEVDAQEWAEAAQLYVNEAFDADVPGLPAASTCGGATCWSVGGRTVAFARDGARTALVLGGADAGALASALLSIA